MSRLTAARLYLAILLLTQPASAQTIQQATPPPPAAMPGQVTSPPAEALSPGDAATDVVPSAPLAPASAAANLPQRPSFELRVDPVIASKVNPILARYTLPVTATTSTAQTAQNFANAQCGGRATRIIRTSTNPDGTVDVTFPACVHSVRASSVTTSTPQPLQTLMAYFGLNLTQAKPSVTRQSTAPKKAPLAAGDVVHLPARAVWTRYRLTDETASGYATFVSALSRAVGCSEKAGAICLFQHGIVIIRLSPLAAIEPERHTSSAALILALTYSRFDRRDLRLAYFMPARSRGARLDRAELEPLSGFLRVAQLTPGAAVPAPVAAPPPQPSAAKTGEVADDQWPYDVKRIAAVLHTYPPPLSPYLAANRAIGVVDNGLASADGSPLQPNQFLGNLYEAKPPPADLNDADNNSYTDDYYGAGPYRLTDPTRPGSTFVGTGDLSLCTDGIANIPTDSLVPASHGSIVASLAAGSTIAASDASLAQTLPPLVFYRLATGSACESPDQQFKLENVAPALDYLFSHTGTVTLSYEASSSLNNQIVLMGISQALKSLPDDFLVVAAGDATIGSLDDTDRIPQCLAQIENRSCPGSDHDMFVSNRVIVVGAATRSLELDRAKSNYGLHTVRFYAPGSATGGYGVDGKPIAGGDDLIETSFAAPRVALAISFLKSFGLNPLQIRDRLEETAWPLATNNDWPYSENSPWVVDLLKVAAVGADMVEIMEKDANQIPRRHTYVGLIDTPFDKALALCDKLTFSRNFVEAIRLSPIATDGSRQYIQYLRNCSPGACRVNRYKPAQCIPGDATFTMQDVLIGNKTIAMKDVTAVVFKLR